MVPKVRVDLDRGAHTCFLSGCLSSCLQPPFTGLEGSDPFLFRDSGPEGSCWQVCAGFQNESLLHSPLRTESSLSSSSPSLSPHSALIPWNLAYLTGSGMCGDQESHGSGQTPAWIPAPAQPARGATDLRNQEQSESPEPSKPVDGHPVDLPSPSSPKQSLLRTVT